MKILFHDIPDSANWTTIKKINKGWSNDEKFYVKTNSGEQYLLRISDGNCLVEEASKYSALEQLNTKDILVAQIITSGKCNNGNSTYRLFEWIEGKEMLERLDQLTDLALYNYGVQSGLILRKIHEVNSPSNWIDWSKYYKEKIKKKIGAYQNCGVRLNKADKILQYIEDHVSLIENRPQSFHHGDYQIGNMIITSQNELAIIDFNRLDFGDPWEEFNRISWTASRSAWMASGQINGYFSEQASTKFFKLMALYIGVNQIGAIPWAIPFGETTVYATFIS